MYRRPGIDRGKALFFEISRTLQFNSTIPIPSESILLSSANQSPVSVISKTFRFGCHKGGCHKGDRLLFFSLRGRRAGAMCLQVRTSPPFQLANLIFRKAVADSNIHERWPIDRPLKVRPTAPTTGAYHLWDTDRSNAAFADSTTTILALCSTTPRESDSATRSVRQ